MKKAPPDIPAVIAPFVFDHRMVFERLPLPEIKKLQREFVPVAVRKGEVLFVQGSTARGVYWLRKGKVKIFQKDFSGQLQILYLYTPGDLIGYRQLISGEPYPFTAVALEAGELDFLPAETFHHQVRESAFFSRNLLEVMSREFTVWTNRFTVFNVRPLRSRLALILLILHEKYRKTGEQESVITFPRTDLADFAAAKLETVVRMLHTFKQEGLVRTEGRRLWLTDILALISIAQGLPPV